MLEKFRKFLANLFKGADSGIAQSGKGQEALSKLDEAAQDFRNQLPVEQVEEVEKIDSPYGTYDPTTKPGEVKPQGEIITPEGDLETRIYSYNPESLTDMQKRKALGAYTDDAVRERYFEEGADETMTLDEFSIKERGYGYPASANAPGMPGLEDKSMADLVQELGEEATGKPVRSPTFEPVTEQVLLFKNPFIEQLSKATGRSEQQIKEAIVERYNAGYAPNDPKRISIDDEEAIERLIDVNVNYGEQTRQSFIDDIVEAVVEKDMMENTGLGQIQKDLTKKSKETSEQLALVRSQSMDVKKILDQIGVDTSSVDFNILANSKDMDAVLAEAKKLKEIMDPLQGGQMEDLARSGNLEKVLTSNVDQAEIDMGRAVEMAERAATPGEVDQARKILEEVKAAFHESLKTGVYKSPFGRSLNAKGGRIGFKDGNKFPTSRRDFLKMLAAGVGTLFAPRGVKEIAEAVATKGATKIPMVDGMPMWFPSLVNKIRTEGKVVRKPDYADFTSGGDTETVYVLKDKNLAGGEIRLYEDEATGTVSVTGRGDEFQQVSLEYTPGENVVRTNELGERGIVTEKPTFDASAQTQSAAKAEERGGFLGNKDTTDDLMGQQSVNVNEKGTFEAGEFAKGERYDIENFGGIDDLQGGVTSWSDLVKSPEKKLDEAAEKFRKEQVNPDVIDDFAKGGRVELQAGGQGGGQSGAAGGYEGDRPSVQIGRDPSTGPSGIDYNPYSSAGWKPIHSQDHLQGGWSQQASDVVGLFNPGRIRGLKEDEFTGPFGHLNYSYQQLKNPAFINKELTKQFGVEHRREVNDQRAYNEARNKMYDDYLNQTRNIEQNYYGLNLADAERDVLMDALQVSANPIILRGGATKQHLPGLSGAESVDVIRQQHSERMRGLSDLLFNNDLADRLRFAHNFYLSEGGRVGYKQGGGVGTLFKRKTT